MSQYLEFCRDTIYLKGNLQLLPLSGPDSVQQVSPTLQTK